MSDFEANSSQRRSSTISASRSVLSSTKGLQPAFNAYTPNSRPTTPPNQVDRSPALLTPSTVSPSTTIQRATRTALPATPGSAGSFNYNTPPSSFPSRLHPKPPRSHAVLNRAIQAPTSMDPGSPRSINSPPSTDTAGLQESLELHPLTPRSERPSAPDTDSPFDDRHSVVFEAVSTDHEEPFEYTYVKSSGPRKQRTAEVYSFAGTSPTSLSRRPISLSRENDPPPRPVSAARRSLYPLGPPIPESTIYQHPDLEPVSPTEYMMETKETMERPTVTFTQALPPTFKGLFALHTAGDWLFILLPAVALSIASSLVQPYMSRVIGEAFNAFVAYPLNEGSATPAQRAALISGIRNTTIRLAATGGAAVVLNYIKGVFWSRHGETVTNRLRHAVYNGVQGKSMEWFDLGMGMKSEGEGEESVGAGGLMAKFTR